jgi:phosphoribosyl 1,2-cyclic phosphodiesterase
MTNLQMTRTSLAFCVLGSGSSGNSTVVVLEQEGRTRLVLIDAGLSPRDTANRMHAVGLSIDSIERVILTHLDQDHFNPGWAKVLQRRGLPVHVHHRHVAATVRSGVAVRLLSIFDDGFDIEGIEVRTCRLPHDELGAIAYRIDHQGARLGHATDLGRVTDDLLDLFHELDALSLESNYCPVLQRCAPRPEFLKLRIMGGQGHLSNRQSLDAVRTIAARSSLQHIALLHLSRQCNTPDRVRELYRREAPELLDRVTITEPRCPTRLLRVSSRSSTNVTHPSREAALSATG